MKNFEYKTTVDNCPYKFGDFNNGMYAVDVLDLILKGNRLIPTDKNYKIYIDTEFGRFKSYFYDWTDDQQNKLIELVNDKKINFAVPGYFYTLPFFCVVDK